MYSSVKDIDFGSFCDVSIGFWNCSDSVAFHFSFYHIAMTTSRSVLGE